MTAISVWQIAVDARRGRALGAADCGDGAGRTLTVGTVTDRDRDLCLADRG